MIFLPRHAIAQGKVGIGPGTPDPSAILDVSSTTKGFLSPRMTEAQRDDIDSPADGLIISCTDCTIAGLHQYINGAWQAVAQSQISNNTGNYGTVVNPVTGKVWLDRNLGATQVATSSADAASYGDLYQWGRGADGHQVRTSDTTSTQATNWLSGGGSWNGEFITTHSNWLNPAETHMWSGTAAENNPCPSGFRVPTNAEWEQERLTWSSSNAAGAFASPLKLPGAGGRNRNTGSLFNVGSVGLYWSSTVSSTDSGILGITATGAGMSNGGRAAGLSLRCLRD
jgi:hypothetical protein